MVNEEPINYQEKVKEIIESQRRSTRAIRKDAVLVNKWIITSTQLFFKDMDQEDLNLFFETALDYFSSKSGYQNMAYAQVHLDETTPHMHLGIVPMADGKLSRKKLRVAKDKVLGLKLGTHEADFYAQQQKENDKIDRATAQRKRLSPVWKSVIENTFEVSKPYRKIETDTHHCSGRRHQHIYRLV